jgi:mono/diheme cytochrome c family protein
MFEWLRTLGAGLAAIAATMTLTSSVRAIDQPGNRPEFSAVERGRYLTAAADCAACHTDPHKSDVFAGGRPIETPFGTLLAPNITADRDTGIGRWSDAQFEAAVRDGKLPNGKREYPAMPFPYYTKMTKDEVLAIRAYLNTLPSVHNPVSSNQLPFPFSIRAVMLLWDVLYFTPGSFKPEPAQSDAWNRGAYLVQGPAHCGACHTPKTILGGDEIQQQFQGYSIQGWFAPNITDDAGRGLRAWSIKDVAEYLKKGHNRISGAAGPMGEEVSNSSSQMTDNDLIGIATYLKDRPGQTRSASPIATADPLMVAGAAIFKDLCSGCHEANGHGVPYLIPDLNASTAVASRDATSLIRVVLRGAQTVATKEEPTSPAMPAFGWQLTDAQVAAVTTYIGNSWGHATARVTEREVHLARSRLAARSD